LSVSQQEIVEDGGVRFQSFIPFVQSDVDYYRCNAAFQASYPIFEIIPMKNRRFYGDFFFFNKNNEIMKEII
jgi:hypothetical protein